MVEEVKSGEEVKKAVEEVKAAEVKAEEVKVAEGTSRISPTSSCI